MFSWISQYFRLDVLLEVLTTGFLVLFLVYVSSTSALYHIHSCPEVKALVPPSTLELMDSGDKAVQASRELRDSTHRLMILVGELRVLVDEKYSTE